MNKEKITRLLDRLRVIDPAMAAQIETEAANLAEMAKGDPAKLAQLEKEAEQTLEQYFNEKGAR